MADKLIEFKPTIDHGIQSTVMAIRETLIGYYKGDVERVLPRSNINLVAVRNSYNHNYQREAAAEINERRLRIDETILLNVKKAPERCEFYTAALSRSRSFRGVREGIEDFFASYLPYVALSDISGGNAGDWRGDRALVMANVRVNKESTVEHTNRQDREVCAALNSDRYYRDSPVGMTFDHGNRTYVMTRVGWMRQLSHSDRSLDTEDIFS